MPEETQINEHREDDPKKKMYDYYKNFNYD